MLYHLVRATAPIVASGDGRPLLSALHHEYCQRIKKILKKKKKVKKKVECYTGITFMEICSTINRQWVPEQLHVTLLR